MARSGKYLIFIGTRKLFRPVPAPRSIRTISGARASIYRSHPGYGKCLSQDRLPLKDAGDMPVWELASPEQRFRW